MPRARPRLFYGWWVVVTSALALFLGPTPIVVFSFGVFLKPLIKEFHSGRGAVSLAFTLHNAIVAFGLPFAGRLVDQFGARRVILPSTFAVGFILLSTYFCSGRIWELYLFYVALGVAGCGTAPVSYCDVISHWFDRYRGLALGFMMFGLGAGALIMPSAAQYLTARFGWRLAFGIFGAAILVITAPVVTIFLKERPEPLGLLPDGTLHIVTASPRPDDDLGMSWGEAWRAPTFWLLFCAFILVSASVQGCLAHIAAIFADRGTPARAAALATSLFGGGLLVGRTGLGYLLDRFFAPRVAALIFCCAAGGIALLRITSSQELAFRGCILHWSRTGCGGGHYGVPDNPLFWAPLLWCDLWFYFCWFRSGRGIRGLTDGRRFRCDRLLCTNAHFTLHRDVNRRRTHDASPTVPIPGHSAW